VTLRISESSESIKKKWPNLTEENARTTSEFCWFYNCLGFAVGDEENWWWPLKEEGIYWPKETPFINTTPNILKMLNEKFNYFECNSGEFEKGYEKIAIYGIEGGYTPKHYAIQSSIGKWKSKLGELEDIEHDTLEALNGFFYGVPIAFAKRKLSD
jgi:hypothetical protein